MSTPRQQQGGLSLQTLVIASLASVAAAIVVHKLWRGGAIIGAAITPVIVAIVSETLRKPVDRVTTLRDQRRQPTQVHRGPSPAPTGPVREDRFGIWQEERQPLARRRSTRLALMTGLLAFVIGACALTASELVFGGSVGGGNDRLTLPVGGEKKRSSEARTTTTETEPQEDQTPTETTPTVPPQEQTPTEAAPPTDTAPVPPVTPTPTEPAPDPNAQPTEPAPAEPAPTP